MARMELEGWVAMLLAQIFLSLRDLVRGFWNDSQQADITWKQTIIQVITDWIDANF